MRGVTDWPDNYDVGVRSMKSAPRHFPFEQVWAPMVEEAWQSVQREVSCVCLSDQAVLDLKGDLLMRVASIGSIPLWEFYTAWALCTHPTALIGKNRNRTEVNEKFVQYMLAAGLRDFIHDKNIVWTRIVDSVRLWKDWIKSFLFSLQRDTEILRNTFGMEGEQSIRHIITPMSDLHNGGRCVMGICTSDKNVPTFLYKPKNLGPEIIFRQVLALIGKQDITLTFREVKVIDGSNYGWVEAVVFREAENEGDLALFYMRVGVLLCVSYILRVTDLHAENILAEGDTPHLLDLEAMFHPPSEGADCAFSVLSTGLLPPAGGNHLDVFGLTAIGGERTGMSHCVWSDVETNGARPSFVDAVYAECTNTPKICGQRVAAHLYADEICRGFCHAYRALRDNYDQLRHLIRQAMANPGFETRVIPRSTMQYVLMLRNLTLQYYDDSSAIEGYIEMALRDGGHHNLFDECNLLKSEADALRRLDVPCFRVRGIDRDVIENNNIVQVCGARGAFDVAARAFSDMSDLDMEYQTGLIRASLATAS